MKFRKKPIEIEAVQMPSRAGDFTRAPQWLKDAIAAETVYYISPGDFAVKTADGVMEGRSGDWIIQGIEGELYPCKRTIFEATYERAPTGIPLVGS